MMSHMRGLPKFEKANSSQRRAGCPRSTTTNPMAATVHAIDVITATFEMPPNPLIPKALGTELIIKPPALSPTKNMKNVMYKPHESRLRMPVCTMPPVSCTAQSTMPAITSTPQTMMPMFSPLRENSAFDSFDSVLPCVSAEPTAVLEATAAEVVSVILTSFSFDRVKLVFVAQIFISAFLLALCAYLSS